MRADGSITLWPESFYREFYHDHVSEGVVEAMNDLQHVRSLLDSESALP